MKKYRIILWILFGIDLVALFYFTLKDLTLRLPGELWLAVGEENCYNLNLPYTLRISEEELRVGNDEARKRTGEEVTIDLGEDFTICGEVSGNYEGELSLFGVIPAGTMQLRVIDREKIIAGGCLIGAYLQTDGVLVLGTSEFADKAGGTSCPAEGILRSGDYIKQINGIDVEDKEDIIELIQFFQDETLQITIRRRTATQVVSVVACEGKDGSYKIGTWIRDDVAGIGTLTYVVPGTMQFGALGHGISDVDTRQLLHSHTGILYPAQLVTIKKGRSGTPGEFVGTIDRSTKMEAGCITGNHAWGITGTGNANLSELLFEEQWREVGAFPIGWKQEITKGYAQVISCASGEPAFYDIEIEEIHMGATNYKELTIHVTDRKLLSLTGGIVQGMSGSPIIQDGKIIGAVTHVFVNDPTRGYGIFIEEMLGE